MTWEEYKAQRRNNSQSASTNSTTSDSWEEYKRKRQEEDRLRQIREEQEAQRQQEEKNRQAQEEQQKAKEREEELKRLNEQAKANMPSEVKDKIDKLSSGNLTKNEELKLKTELGNIAQAEATQKLANQEFTLPKAQELLQAKKNPNKENDFTRSLSNLGLGLKKGGMDYLDNSEREGKRKIEEPKKVFSNLLGKVASNAIFGDADEDNVISDAIETATYSQLRTPETEKEKEDKKQWEAKKNEIDAQIASNIENSETGIGKFVAETTPSIGHSLPSMVPGIGLDYSLGSASGAYYDDGIARGMTEDEAYYYSKIMGGLEGTADYIGSSLTRNVFENFIKGTSKEALKSFGLDVLEGFVEEAVMEPISEATATATGGEETADWNNMPSRMFDAGLKGGFAEILTAGTSAGIGKAVNVTNKINNNQQVSSYEVLDAVNETLKSDKIDQEALKEKVKQGTNNTINSEINQNIENNQETLPTARIHTEINEQRTASVEEMINESKPKRNIINEKVNEYIKETEKDFKSEINLDTKKLNEGNAGPIDYEKAGQSVLSNKAKSLVDKLKKRVFKNNNENIFVSNADINKSISETLRNKEQKPYVKENLAVFSQLDKIIENAKEIGFSAEDNKGRNYKDYKYYVSNAYIDGKPYVVEFDTRIQKGSTGQDERHFRLERVYPLNNNEAVSNVVPKTDNSLLNETASTNSIPSSTEEVNTTNNYMQNTENNTQKNIVLNPTEITNISKENMKTTPKLETKNYKEGNKQSSFTSNILNDAKFLNKDLRQEMAKDENIRYYSGITNEETLEKAYNSLKEGGEKETLNWFNKSEKNISAEDVTKGWILLKQYQDAGDYQGAVEVAKKMRQMGTSAGQAVQAYNIMARMSPEGMFYYAQSELNEAYNKMVEGKSKQWIEKNQDKFTLTPEETQTIIDTMKEVGEMPDGREKTVKLAQIQKLVSDKIPPSAGQSIKAWMRISMLFNPKTQVRNVMGNTIVLPVNATADIFSGAMDKLISKKTGVRTTGITKEGIKGYGKGFKKGLFESYDDFRKRINTKNVEGNRFEIGEGKSFKDKGVGKALNRIDNILNFALDVGDRPFYEASFTNSINNQLVLNNTMEVTKDMIDIASNEALQRTWQDDNNYTKIVLGVRRYLNTINVKGYGLGDVLIPFAKTPANLTKAIVDYSPVGLTKTLTLDARKFNNSLNNGQYSPQLQHKFVQNLGKGMSGTLLYVLGYGLAKAGIATGEADDDKDVKNFMKNSLGISSYSIKIGDKSFTYDWAQPIATPLAIMSNYVKYSKDSPDATAITKAIKASTIGSEQLLEQSFLQSINKIFNGNGTALENLSDALLELPARAIPTFSKQIADMVDGTQRTSFEYDNKLQSAANSVIAKIPLASKSLPASVDTLGNEIKKHGGNNNLFNVMINPANTNKGQLSVAGKEIYDVYMQTGDTTIFPRTAPYYINSKGEKTNMTAEERNRFQTVSGKYVEDSLSSLMKDSDYKKLNNDKKAEIINEIVDDSYSKAKYDVLKIDSDEYEKKRNTLKEVKPSSYYNYKFKTDGIKKDSEKIDVLVNGNYTNKEKTALYENYILSSTDNIYPIVKDTGININEYLKYKQQDFSADKKDDGTINGKSISGSAKNKRLNYIQNMNITYMQKLILYGTEYTLSDNEQTQIVNYIKGLNKTRQEKLDILSKLKGFTIYKDGRVEY